MAKKRATTKKAAPKVKKPKVGDTVYVKGDSKGKRWLFYEVIVKDGREQAKCISREYDVENDSSQPVVEIFPIDWLTLEPPSQPSPIFIG